jgi:DNA-binding NarL/FixJ family response regulator
MSNETPDMIRTFKLQKRGLRPREIEVSLLVAKGLKNREIGDTLFISEKTVKFHLTNAFRRMEVDSRAQLMVKVGEL